MRSSLGLGAILFVGALAAASGCGVSVSTGDGAGGAGAGGKGLGGGECRSDNSMANMGDGAPGVAADVQGFQ